MPECNASEEREEKHAETTAEPRATVALLQRKMRDFAIKTKPDPHLRRELTAGFLLPYLLDLDALTYGRWHYWLEAMERQKLPERPLPHVDWLEAPDPRTRKMIETTLDAIPRYGSWQSHGGWQYFCYLMQWMLWGFGHPGCEEPAEPEGCEGASLRVYQTLDIGSWMLFAYDYLGDLLVENAYGRQQEFFPTPMAVCRLMAEMTLDRRTTARRLSATRRSAPAACCLPPATTLCASTAPTLIPRSALRPG